MTEAQSHQKRGFDQPSGTRKTGRERARENSKTAGRLMKVAGSALAVGCHNDQKLNDAGATERSSARVMLG